MTSSDFPLTSELSRLWGPYQKVWAWAQRKAYWKKRERVELCKILDRRPPGNILDMGCNSGYLTSVMQRHTGAEVVGTDVNLDALGRGARDYPDVTFLPPSEVNAKGVKYDAILLSHVLEHVEDCNQMIGHLAGLLSARGRLIVIVPQERIRGDVSWPHIVMHSLIQKTFVNPHVRIVRLSGLREMVSRHGLAVEEHVYINYLPPVSSQRLVWPFSFSLIATCGRASNTSKGSPA